MQQDKAAHSSAVICSAYLMVAPIDDEVRAQPLFEGLSCFGRPCVDAQPVLECSVHGSTLHALHEAIVLDDRLVVDSSVKTQSHSLSSHPVID